MWAGWLEAATAPAVVTRPGLVIDNADEVAGGPMAKASASFGRNGHRAKLDRADVTVHEVDGAANRVLPPLASA